MQITEQQLRKIAPFAPAGAGAFIPHLNAAMLQYGITTPQRVTAFLAQLAHESGSFRYVREIADGSEYEGRIDLGNVQPGDGKKYKGRGLIQITGRDNYRSCGKSLGLDLLTSPQMLETPQYAAKSAAWFWSIKGLNAMADAGDFRGITRKINGGLNGYADRVAFLERAKKAIV